MLKTKIAAALTLSLLAGTTTLALAGAKGGQNVTVIANADDTGEARGTMSHVRNSGNTLEFIRCEARYQTQGGAENGWTSWCAARDARGTSVNCFTFDPEFAKLVVGINGDSHIAFEFHGSVCKEVFVSHSSVWEPKQP